MKMVSMDIENAKTQKVITIKIPLISYKEKNFECDISNLTNDEMEQLINAINEDLEYTDIELFFFEGNDIPKFGPDYHFEINNNKLIATYTRKFWEKCREKEKE